MRAQCVSTVLGVCLATLVQAENKLWIENGEALPGTPGISLGLLATHDDPLHAFSAALRYEVDVFSFTEFDLDSSDAITGQVGAEYAQVLHDPDRGEVVLAVLLDLDPPHGHQAIPASPTEPQRLANVVMQVVHGATPGAYMTHLRNAIGSPPIDNTFSTFGRSILPELDGGNIDVADAVRLLGSIFSGQAADTLTCLDPVGC